MIFGAALGLHIWVLWTFGFVLLSLGIAVCDNSVGSHYFSGIPWESAARGAFVFFAAMAPVSAEEAAIRGALGRTHGVYKLARPLVDALVTYYLGRGESLTDIPLDVPSGGTVAHERRWRARLLAAAVTDAGDSEDFLLWMEARAAPVGSGGAGSASGLAKVALVALEAAGDRPSVRGLVELEKALALGEAGDEEAQCQCALVAFLLIWGRET